MRLVEFPLFFFPLLCLLYSWHCLGGLIIGLDEGSSCYIDAGTYDNDITPRCHVGLNATCGCEGCIIDNAFETPDPTPSPTSSPSETPTDAPSNHPIDSPTKEPTKDPTKYPTKEPTKYPTTKSPTTGYPTNVPSKEPTRTPTASNIACKGEDECSNEELLCIGNMW